MDGWQQQRSKRNKKTKSVSEISQPIYEQDNRQRQSSSETIFYNNKNEKSSFEKIQKMPGNVYLWIKFIIDGKIEKFIENKLQSLSMKISGPMTNLWDNLLHHLKKNNLQDQQFKNHMDLKAHIYDKCDDKYKENPDIIYIKKKKNRDSLALEFFCETYNVQLKIYSIIKDLNDIIYGCKSRRSIHLLHVGLDNFFPLTEQQYIDSYKFTSQDKDLLKKLNELKSSNETTVTNRKQVENERKSLEKLRRSLQDMEMVEEYDHNTTSNNQSNLFYSIYSPEKLNKMKDLILCNLKLINAHSGKAIPIENRADMKFKEISLNSRHNCGYNAFENDIVYVKIHDQVKYTGKVMGVCKSDHKPVNKIYICKVSKDQGTLMTPIDKTIPKIHVDNNPGRRHYEKNKDCLKSRNLLTQQKTVKDIEKESAKYADNLYFSQFKFTVPKDRKKPVFSEAVIKSFNPEICEQLFIVVYEYWDPHFMYPTGKIIGTLSSYNSLNDNYSLLSTLCNIEPLDLNEKYKNEVKEIINKVHKLPNKNTYIPSTAIVFTIDDEATKDMDDAISYHKEGNEIIIGVHIADVTKYITSTQEIYKQASKRMFTSYPPKFSKITPNHILDKELATHYLSLLPNEYRSVVSIFFRFSETVLANPRQFKLTDISNPVFKEGIIQSKYRLNYNDVTRRLKKFESSTDAEEGDLIIALFETYQIAKIIRRARLPESYFIRSLNSYNKDFQIENQFEANVLIEEFMLLTNEYVAKKIYEHFPNNTLLRIQDPVSDYENWVERLLAHTNMNFTAKLKEYCNLLDFKISNVKDKKALFISRKFYDNFCTYLENDIDKARNLLQYDVLYNEFFVHITEWYELSKSARYERSRLNCQNNGHFSLQKPLYTHFTSPIRRFTDIVVHYLLKSIINNIQINEESIDIDHLCSLANKKSKDNKNFEKLCAPFAIFEETEKKYCFTLDCACIDINNEEIRLAHPILQKAASVKILKFANLSLNEVPLLNSINENVDNCILKWKKIIFTYQPSINQTISNNKFIVDSHLYDCSLPHSAFRSFREIRRSYLPVEKLRTDLHKLRNNFEISQYETHITSDCFSFANSIIDIELQIFIKNTLRVQFSKYRVNGLPKISPELYIVAPTFQICLIHQDDPVRFFIPDGKLKLRFNDIKKEFDSILDYKDYFEPLIQVESLVETLSETAAFTLINVPILWIVGNSEILKKKQRYGVIILSYEFCKSRNIIFNDENDEIVDRYEYIIEKGIKSVGGDLLCLRYKHETWSNYWVGHGEVLYVGKYKNNVDNFKVIVFLLTQSDYDSFTNSEEARYTIDVYLKSVVSKRQQETLETVDQHCLLKDVILGNQMSSDKTDQGFIDRTIHETEKIRNYKFNRNQQQAIYKAMNEKLSLIWGPPGTGKTHIGCILSYVYTMKNKQNIINLKISNVVLYCGPSNDCVNLVAREMQNKFNEHCPKLLRIFGEQQELADFPLPGFFVKTNVPLTDEIRQISLHHLVRKGSGSLAESLRKFDTKFKEILNSPHLYNTRENIRLEIHSTILAYRETLKEAKINFIENNKYDMVLCTTSVTATFIMRLFNVTQIIIDEAGMCKEPETLIPICSAENTVQNVVLIGDHKQLRPIIRHKIANKRGLQISLFERYQEIRPDLVTMLNFQYRMHPSICKFPSKQFYDNKLRTATSQLWSGLGQEDICGYYREWNGYDYRNAKPYYKSVLKQSNFSVIPNEEWPAARNNLQFDKNSCPERLVFIHVVGDEITQSITTSTGNENSRGNRMEVEAVGNIYEKLISRFVPPRRAPSFVTVLTQYKLQQHLIQTKCKEILMKRNLKSEPLVKTVIRSQGSENDYIIFSTVRSIRSKEDINLRPTPGWEKQYLGFISDPNQINVALTRARKGLIIIGNKNLLRVNSIWKNLIGDLEKRNCIIDNYLDFL